MHGRCMRAGVKQSCKSSFQCPPMHTCRSGQCSAPPAGRLYSTCSSEAPCRTALLCSPRLQRCIHRSRSSLVEDLFKFTTSTTDLKSKARRATKCGLRRVHITVSVPLPCYMLAHAFDKDPCGPLTRMSYGGVDLRQHSLRLTTRTEESFSLLIATTRNPVFTEEIAQKEKSRRKVNSISLWATDRKDHAKLSASFQSVLKRLAHRCRVDVRRR